jgi:uncharacterized protein (DUF1697 family)
MPERWVALLRGINLGPRNRVAMADLRRAFEEAGCNDVETYIQSGNVLFSADGDRDELTRRLESAVARELGVESTIVLRRARELAKLVGAHPFGEDTSKTHVVFLAKRPSAAAVRALRTEDVAPDEVEAAGSDVFMRLPNGVQGARVTGALVERRLGVPGTMRTWRTVERLAARATPTP